MITCSRNLLSCVNTTINVYIIRLRVYMSIIIYIYKHKYLLDILHGFTNYYNFNVWVFK